MRKQNSILSPTKPQKQSFIAQNKLKKSITFAELAEEEAREACHQVDEVPVTNINFKDIDRIVEACQRISNKTNQDEESYEMGQDRPQQNMGGYRPTRLAANLNIRPKFRKENAYNKYVQEDAVYNYDVSSFQNEPKYKRVDFNHAPIKSKSFVKGFTAVDQTNSRNGKIKMRDLKPKHIKVNIELGSKKHNRTDLHLMQQRMAELESEKEHYVSNIADLQNYAQKLEGDIFVQMKKDHNRINKLEKLLEHKTPQSVMQPKNFGLYKNKQDDNSMLEEVGHRYNVNNMDSQLETLIDLHNIVASERTIISDTESNGVSVHKLVEENNHLRCMVDKVTAELNRMSSLELINMALITKINTSMQYQNTVIEDNQKLKLKLKELEAHVQKIEVFKFPNINQQVSDADKIIEHLKHKMEAQVDEIKDLKAENFFLREEVQKSKLRLGNIEYANVINKNAFDSFGHKEIRQIAMRTEDLERDHSSINEETGRYGNMYQEKTFKSSTADSDGKGSNQFGESNNTDVLASPTETNILHIGSEACDTMRSSTTFGIKLQSVEI